MAQRIVDVVNESIQIANDSTNIETRRSRVLVAREKIQQLEELAEQYPFLKITRVADIERNLTIIDHETDQLPEGVDKRRKQPDHNAFLKASLLKQCQDLGIPIDVVSMERTDGYWIVSGKEYKRPEDAAFAYFQEQGWEGAACEGSAVLMLMKAACLDYLAAVNTFGSRQDACTRYFEAQCIIHRERSSTILREIEHAQELTLRSNITEIMAQSTYAILYPRMSIEALLAIWRILTAPRLATLASHIFADPSYRAGWPDLTLVRDNELLFVEVKTTDKLHISQRDVILDILKRNNFAVSVLRLKPSRP